MAIESFDSFDEMMRRMRGRMGEADARVQPWQAAIKPGDCIRKATPYGFSVYAEVLEDPEPRQEETTHYRFCRCYGCPILTFIISRSSSLGHSESCPGLWCSQRDPK